MDGTTGVGTNARDVWTFSTRAREIVEVWIHMYIIANHYRQVQMLHHYVALA
jgi:hypothetical protein